MTSSAFWSGKTVLLTGHTGFKGSWMSLLLHRLGARVVGLSNGVPTAPALFDLARVGEAVADRRGDVTDARAVAAAFGETEPDIVIHMAAQPIVKVGYSDPIGTYATNVMGTAHVLDAARRTPSVRVVLVVTTDKCYDNKEWHWGYREIDQLGGNDPYSSSKACAELVAASFRRSFFEGGGTTVAIATARAGNVIGGGDFAADRIVPDAVRAFGAALPLQVRNAAAVRPWQHVLDPLWGYAVLIEHAWRDTALFSEAWNFGPGADNEQSVEALIDGMVTRWGGQASWQHETKDHPKETRLLRIDAAKATQRLRWRPQLPFDDMLNWVVDWYVGVARGQDARQLTERQIERYLSFVL